MGGENILYIFTDQLRGDCIGGEVKTPHLEEIKASSISFSQCMSNSPLCVPARAALMTGQLPRESGVWSNRKGADINGPSHVRNIQRAHYRTAVIGKTHLWRTGAGPRPGLHAREKRHLLHQWGFDDVCEVNDPIGTGSQYCAYTDHLQSLGGDWLERHRAYIGAWIAEIRSGNPSPWDQIPAPVPSGEDIDSFIGKSAVQWLENYDDSNPFYLQVQFTGPHDPYDGPWAYRSLYDFQCIELGIAETPVAPIAPHVAARVKRQSALSRATNQQRQRWRVNYFANISLIDFWVGELLRVLARRGLADKTWLIFSSDHGEMLGDHGMMGKAVFYAGATEIPLIIRPPEGAAGVEVTDLTDQLDVSATILDIADAAPFEHCLGRSLLPYLTGYPPPLKPIVCELFGETTVITQDWKFTVESTRNTPRQLFDRHEDTFELVNLVDNSDYHDVMKDLIDEHLKPLAERLNTRAWDDYQAYVAKTGSWN